MGTEFDRIRPPQGRPYLRTAPEERGGGRLSEARESLFSVGGDRVPGCSLGLGLHCSRCGAATPLDAGTALRAAIPVFLVLPWRRHPIFGLCPACDRRAWLRLGAAREE